MPDNVFASPHPLVAHKLTKLRDRTTEPKKFRELIREIAGLIVYEATLDLATVPTTVMTPLAEAPAPRWSQCTTRKYFSSRWE